MSLDAVLAALEDAGVGIMDTIPANERIGRVAVNGVQQDSRAISPGEIFLAWTGSAHDAHDYLPAAASAGAAAAIVERSLDGLDLPQVQVDNARLAAAVAAGFVAGSPWRSLRTVGITGTNGKTTTALLLRELLAARGGAAAIGTLGVVGANGRVLPGTEGLTTPGPVHIAERLSALVRQGTANVVLETSSHALDQHRLDGVRFDVAAFTNLTRDHLDYHGTMDRYLAAKSRLLRLGKDGCTAVINADDPAWRALAPTGAVLTYGLNPGADVRAENVRSTGGGSRFDLVVNGERARVALPLPGDFNVSNALCAAACALALARPLAAVAAGLTGASAVPGRMERVAHEPFDVVIDFAHTPDALEQALRTLRPLVKGRLIVVFGAGGDRDPTKRPKMGAAVGRHADVAVVTSDNPRSEDPATIAAEVTAGVRQCEAVEIVDRLAAIQWALDAARPGDAVIIAGKGHETYQVVGEQTLPFDERRIVREHLDKREHLETA